MSVIETRMSVWEALAGRAPGRPLGPADAGLWHAVAERLNPARAKPQLRPGIEEAELTTARGIDYVMLRSPDGAKACYLRLTPEELRLARLMDGTRTVARLVAEFARIAGRLAPDQVTRVVADLAGNRMLEELPVDAFLRLQRVHRRPWPARLGRGLLAAARGQRVVLASIDPLVGFLYKIGGRLLFTRVAVVLAAIVSLAGLSVFVWRWMRGDNSVFLASDSYVTGAIVLLGLNVFALACHEFGHALAAKHAGRRVPAAGFLVYFGIPSIFVDTTDVWMAGRKARIVTTATGPATGLVLAGLSQLVGLFYPDLAPWTFKLAFAWYLNALFNLNPFMALDGYYLLMDWLEVPNLRARGLAWVMARLRRRPPRFGDLDREGRLVALYGMLAVVWIAIAVNLAYRVYTDRVAGLVVGLWRSGWAARALLVAVLAGLAAPVVYLLLGWVAKRLRRTRGRFGERRLERDEPRRLSALRSSALRQLPVAALTQLAEQARWVHPRTGQQLVFAGAAQSNVYVVIDGALEARRPGDPTGSVRERVGAGGVVGLANALTGAPAALAWHTAGTTLLALPSNAVAGVVGPLPGPPPVERAELENLFAETPALAALSDEDRLGVLTRARPLALPPGAPVLLTGPADAVVVASGVLVLPTGAELRRGSMIGPYGDGLPGHVATARTAARVWTLPAVAGLPLLVGVGAGVGGAGVGGAGVGWSAGAGAPAFGAHPLADYPPLASPPGPPPSNVDDEVDRRFERKLWWLLILLLLFALFLTGTNLFSGPVWAEMPADRALLSVTRGGAKAHVDGVDHALGKGGEIYVHEGDTVRVANRSIATLTFRGGSVTVLCAGTDLGVGGLISEATQPIQPKAKLRLSVGKLLVGTQGTSKAFKPLTVQIGSSGPLLTNDGVARFAMTPGSTEVGTGVVTRGGNVVSPSPDADLRCGDGVALPKPGGTPAVAPSPSDSPSAAPSPSDVPSAAPSSSDSPLPGATTRSPTPRSTTKSPTKGPTAGPTPTTSPLPPANKPPAITWVQQPTGTIDQVLNSGAACNGGPTTASLSVVVTDDHDTGNNFRVTVEWTVFASGSNTATWRGNWYGSVGPVSYPGTANRGGTLAVTVTATDSGGLSASVSGKVAVYACNPNAIP